MEVVCEEKEKRDIENKSSYEGNKTENETVIVSPYEKKYYALLRRCQNVQQNNERLLNRICYVKKLLRRLRKERRFLMKKLDKYGDDYKNIPLALFTEEEGSATCPVSSTISSNETIIPSANNFITHPATVTTQFTNKHVTPNSCHTVSKKKPRQEKEKDPNAPKRPANPFFLFCQEQRSSVMEKYQQEQKEEITHQELTKTLAKNWNNLLAEDKKPSRATVYYEMYEKEKERYEQEMKIYTEKDNPSNEKL
ncbi:uncharacterized protein [Centruroides vittatus]|uniref:uncharacterized protein isoform X1 n=1 Tax=Centruroides vittatus TaxID=120091 RepID=UPI00350F87EB